MDVLAAILTCSLHADDALVRAIIDNAHDNPLAIFTPDLDPATGSLSSTPETLGTAVAQLGEITSHGGRALVGLMQIPVAWASTFGREPQDLFDPCINLSIGSAMLSEFDYWCARAKASQSNQLVASRRACVLPRYAEAIRMPELVTVAMLGIRHRGAPPVLPSDVPIFPTATEGRTWGSDCIFVTNGVGAVPSHPDSGPRRREAAPGRSPQRRADMEPLGDAE
jgi:hypothetical protein